MIVLVYAILFIDFIYLFIGINLKFLLQENHNNDSHNFYRYSFSITMNEQCVMFSLENNIYNNA